MKEIDDFKYRDKGKDSLTEQKHFHNHSYEILHIISGKGTMMIKDKLFPLKPECIFFINGLDVHCSVPEKATHYVRNKIILSSEFVNDIATITDCNVMIEQLFLMNGVCVELSVKQSASIDEWMLKIKEKSFENKYDSKLNIAFYVFAIMDLALNNQNKSIAPIQNTISEVMEYINQNIEKKITLNEISQELHISKYYLCRTFKNVTNTTIFDYILLTRLAMAKKMLLETHWPISQIAMNTGFCSFAYFSKIFKEKEGFSPSQFRREMNSVPI